MNSMGEAPSKKVFYFLVATVFVVVFTISYSSYRSRNPRGSRNVPDPISQVTITNPVRDITSNLNRDRFVNWQDSLSRAMETETVMGEESIDEMFMVAEEGTVTAEVSERLILEIIESLSSGREVDFESFTNQLLDESASNITYTNKFEIGDINIVENTDDNIREYINTLLLKSVEEFLNIPENATANHTIMIRTMTQIYENLSLILSNINVPSKLSEKHLAYINSLGEIVYFAEILLKENTDPILAFSSISKFENAVMKADALYTEIITYPENNDIIFEEDDFAYEFYNPNE